VHFACHGIAHLLTPLKSALILAGDEALTLEALLRPAPARQHPNTRLAVLSACESLLPGVALPDEVISLPTGLLQAGVAGIIATQWKISGLAAALMVIKFYTEWLHQPTKPAAALQSAARWLRDSTNAEKAAALNPLAKHESLSKPTVRALWRQIVRLPPEQRSFAHLSDWAAFAYVGA
jgi:CHAT domain-containing protein